MDEYQPFERLDADNDFEGGEYINGEFYYRKKRKAAQQTEDDRILGVFQGSDDEGEGFGGSRRRRKREDGSAGLHKRVGFVSKGFVQNAVDDKEETPTASDHPASSEPQPEQVAAAPGLGTAGLGLAVAYADENDDEEEEEETATGLARAVQMRAQERRKAQTQQREAESQRKKVLKADPELAKFEQHSKGIGSKLLKMMGWKPGEGLGVKRDGIAKPLEASLRPKNAGLGATGMAEPSLKPREPAKAAAKVQAPQESNVKAAWKQQNRVKAKPVVKTAEQVLQEQEGAAGEGGKPTAAAPPTMTILDMTGPQTRVVTSLEQLAEDGWGAADADDAPFPELQHNMKLLEEMAEADIVQSDAKLRHTRDTALLLQDDLARLQRDSDACAAELARATHVLETLRIVDQRGAAVPLDDLEAVYHNLLDEYPQEYTMFDVASIALRHVLPLLKAAMAGWAPTAAAADPWLPAFVAWKKLLESQDPVLSHGDSDDAAGGDPFAELCMAVLFDPLRRCVMGAWAPQQPEALLRFFDSWSPVMPRSVLSHLLAALVMPRLRQCTNDWDPLKDPVPVHKWLHPWLPYISEPMKELYPTIRGKLAAALQAWQAWDFSAYEILKPWHKVWDKKDWDLLLGRCIVPPLVQAMHSILNLNPLEKDDRPCEWAMMWADIMPLHHMATIYEEGFFPKFHQVLHFWLIHSPKYDEVWTWYESYKKTRLPANLPDDDRIRHQLNVAFRAINDAQNGRPFPPGYPVVLPLGAGEGVAPSSYMAPAPVVVEETRSLKEWLAMEAAERGLTFIPRPGRMVAGLQVHALGKLSVVVDTQANVLKAFKVDRWVPMSLEEIITEALQRG